MDDLLKGIYDVVKDQHFNKIQSLSNKLKRTEKSNRHLLKGFFNIDSSNQALDTLLNLWNRSDYSNVELASILVGASLGCTSESNKEKTELVWTGPDLNLLPVRRSEQVLLDLIDSAKETLFIISFVLVNIPKIEEALKRAINRGVDVRLLLESEDKSGSSSFIDTIFRLYTEIPNIRLYVWPRDKRENIQGGFARVHAKCAVADSRLAFVTSANLTAAALDRNIEMGVQINGGSTPENMVAQFTSMISAKEIIPFQPNSSIATSPPKQDELTYLEDLPERLEPGRRIKVEFDNTKVGKKEVHSFLACDLSLERPKTGSLVIIRHNGQYLVGKYRWSKQQNTENNEQHYVVTIKGFAPTERIIIAEHDWEHFKPIAVAEIE
mgnify:FL=1